MSGHSLVVDTNILIYLLNGDKTVEAMLEGNPVFLSFISRIELLSYQEHSARQLETIRRIFDYTTFTQSNEAIVEKAIAFRKNYKIKTPDAIVLATSAYLGSAFVYSRQAVVQNRGCGYNSI